MKQHKCSSCGKEDDEMWMMPFNTGRRVQYLCWICYKRSQKDNNYNQLRRSELIEKKMKQQKRSGQL